MSIATPPLPGGTNEDPDTGRKPPSDRPSGVRPPPGPRRPSPAPQESAWSLRIATVSGIPIRLHFTFLLILIYFAISGLSMGSAGIVLSTVGLFLCVALHELGHSLVAQRYGYKVRDITLYPIGGVASIEGTPRPRHELYIALAGPAVNVVIAALLYGVLTLTSTVHGIGVPSHLTENPLSFLLAANEMLVLFNMIPAFPMDGGRVLRAVLGLRLGTYRATQIAATIGQLVAVLMGLVGLGVIRIPDFPPNIMLVIIALFVFFGAAQERNLEETRDVVEDAPVGAAMVRDFQTLAVGDTLRRAAEVLLATTQQDFPVVHGDDVAGVLSRGQLLRALAQQGDGAYVAGAMTRDVLFARPNDRLEEFMLRPDGVQRAPVLVRDESDRLVGMLTQENLMEFLTLRQIARAQEAAQE
jgi:Zn-dependent protease/CBS domain-containing protein